MTTPAPRLATYFHVHLVSDSTGETLNAMARAVCARFDNVLPIEHIYALVRSQRQLDRALGDIEEAPGVVIHTIVDDGLREALEEGCRRARHALHPGARPAGLGHVALPGLLDHHPGRRAPAARQRLFQPHGRAELRHRP